jgi:hypothetical protein
MGVRRDVSRLYGNDDHWGERGAVRGYGDDDDVDHLRTHWTLYGMLVFPTLDNGLVPDLRATQRDHAEQRAHQLAAEVANARRDLAAYATLQGEAAALRQHLTDLQAIIVRIGNTTSPNE